MENHIVCPKCQEINTKNATMCVNCYARLDPKQIVNPEPIKISDLMEAEQRKERQINRWYFIYSYISLIGLIIIGYNELLLTGFDSFPYFRYILSIGAILLMQYAKVHPDALLFLTRGYLFFDNPEPSDYYYFTTIIEAWVMPALILGINIHRSGIWI